MSQNDKSKKRLGLKYLYYSLCKSDHPNKSFIQIVFRHLSMSNITGLLHLGKCCQCLSSFTAFFWLLGFSKHSVLFCFSLTEKLSGYAGHLQILELEAGGVMGH